MSTANVGTLELSGEEGYNTGVSKLNELCTKYGTNARSITVEDINKVTGYDPKNQGDGTVYGAGNEYFLASLAVEAQSFMSTFNMLGVSSIGLMSGSFILWDSTFLPSSSSAGVCAVVPLESV